MPEHDDNGILSVMILGMRLILCYLFICCGKEAEMQKLGNFQSVAEFACEVCQAKNNEVTEINIPCGYRALADEYCPMLLECARKYCDVSGDDEAEIMYIDGIAGTKPDTALQSFAKSIKRISREKIEQCKTAYREAHTKN